MVIKARNSGKSVVLTSHSMEECEVLCTRLVRIHIIKKFQTLIGDLAGNHGQRRIQVFGVNAALEEQVLEGIFLDDQNRTGKEQLDDRGIKIRREEFCDTKLPGRCA